MAHRNRWFPYEKWCFSMAILNNQMVIVAMPHWDDDKLMIPVQWCSWDCFFWMGESQSGLMNPWGWKNDINKWLGWSPKIWDEGLAMWASRITLTYGLVGQSWQFHQRDHLYIYIYILICIYMILVFTRKTTCESQVNIPVEQVV